MDDAVKGILTAGACAGIIAAVFGSVFLVLMGVAAGLFVLLGLL